MIRRIADSYCKEITPSDPFRRVHLSDRPHGFIGLDLELLNQASRYLESWTLRGACCEDFRGLSGAFGDFKGVLGVCFRG